MNKKIETTGSKEVKEQKNKDIIQNEKGKVATPKGKEEKLKPKENIKGKVVKQNDIKKNIEKEKVKEKVTEKVTEKVQEKEKIVKKDESDLEVKKGDENGIKMEIEEKKENLIDDNKKLEEIEESMEKENGNMEKDQEKINESDMEIEIEGLNEDLKDLKEGVETKEEGTKEEEIKEEEEVKEQTHVQNEIKKDEQSNKLNDEVNNHQTNVNQIQDQILSQTNNLKNAQSLIEKAFQNEIANMNEHQVSFFFWISNVFEFQFIYGIYAIFYCH